MKNIRTCLFTKVLFCTILATTIYSCSKSEDDFLIQKEAQSNIDTDNTVMQLNAYMKYFIADYKDLYDKENGFIDLDELDKRIMSYNFIPTRSTRSTITTEEQMVDINLNENILLNVDKSLASLSPEAEALISSFLSAENNDFNDYEALKEQAKTLNLEDQEQLAPIFSISDCFIENLNQVNTNEQSALACNIITGVLASVTGSIWGAAFGGPVGYAVCLGWSVAGAIAAYKRCK